MDYAKGETMKTLLIPYITIGGHYDFGMDVYNDNVTTAMVDVSYHQGGDSLLTIDYFIPSRKHKKWLVSKIVQRDGDYEVIIDIPSNCYLSAFLLDKRGSTTYVPAYEVQQSLGE